MSTSVMPHVMSVLDLSNVSARSVTVNETVKKSYATFALGGDILPLRGMYVETGTYCTPISISPCQYNQ